MQVCVPQATKDEGKRQNKYMIYFNKEKDFITSLVSDNRIGKFYWDGKNGHHIELPTFKVKVSAWTMWRYAGGGKEVKDLEMVFWKPIIKKVSKYRNGETICIEITSPNHLELSLEMTKQKSGYWTGDAYIFNHHKRWRWSEHTRNGFITRTFCDEFMKYLLYKMEILQ